VKRTTRSVSVALGALALGFTGLVLPAPAVAATTPTIVEVGDGYHFVGGAENNDVTLSIVSGRILVHDEGATAFGYVGAKCFAVPVGTGAAVSCKLKSPTIFHADLGDGDDTFDSTAAPKNVRIDIRTGGGTNFVTGGPGNDVARGETGTDVFNGGAGNDRLTAGTGDSFLNGGDGNDVFVGGPAIDVVQGGAGGDYVRTGPGNDLVFGNAGNDGLSGDGDDDLINGGPGNDHVYGGEGDDDLTGDAGRDNITGNEGDDQLNSVDNARDGGDCGGGTDVLTADAPAVFLGFPTGGDATYFNNCETVNEV
jgi:Ca2+-binding RTX toxin-like protein